MKMINVESDKCEMKCLPESVHKLKNTSTKEKDQVMIN